MRIDVAGFARGSGTNVAQVNQLIKQYVEMRQMMRQLTSSGMFGGGGLKSKMLRKMTGMPDMAGFSGDMDEMPALPAMPSAGPSRKKLKKKRKKKRTKVCSGASSVLSASLWGIKMVAHHRGTENTKEAQRRSRGG